MAGMATISSRQTMGWVIELWKDYLVTRSKGERSHGIGVIQAKIACGEANGNTKYSSHFPQREDWEPSDHFARFHYNVKLEILSSNEGVFWLCQEEKGQPRK